MNREMKNTGIPYIGTIPSEWKIIPIKAQYMFYTGFTPPSGQDEYYDPDGETWITIADMKKDVTAESEKHITKSYAEQKGKKIPMGSLLYSFKLSVGKTSVLGCDAYTNEAIAAFPSDKNPCIEYLRYSSMFIEGNANENIYGAKILNQQLINNAPVPYPPISEQRAIASYLDTKCSAIDEAIERHKKIIEKLEEYRKNNITRLATKGFGYTTMKDSGYDWYGHIPSDWELKRFKYIAKVMSNLVDPEPYMDLPQVGPDIIEKDSGRLVGERTVEESGIISGNHLFYKGQLLYSKVRPALNKVVTAPFTGLCSADMYPIEAEINSEYLKWLMLSKPFTEQTRIIASIRVKMPKINQDELGNVMCVVPPMEEQEKIALAIQEMCDKVQTSIDKHNDVIHKLDEYRKSIIYNAVTGKIDCRTEAVE